MGLQNWYINRLKSMGPREAVFRLINHLKTIYEKRVLTGRISPTETVKTRSILPIRHSKTSHSSVPIIPLLDFSLDITKQINFHQDPVTRNSFALEFSRDIDIRFARNISAKRVWEINRLQFLPDLALGVKTKKENLQIIFNHIDAWHKQNPYLLGVNWYSAMEVGLRLVSFLLTWEILDFDKISALDARAKCFKEYIWLPIIHQHMKHLSANFSKYSSANNHLIAEAAALYVSSVFWNFKESPKWECLARNILEREIKKQHSEDGVNLEEASHYARFVFDALSFAQFASTHAQSKLSSNYKNTLKKIANYLQDATNPANQLVQYGDCDDGRFLPAQFQTELHSKKPKSVFYKKEGHFFLKKGGRKKNIFFHFNAAPLGYLSVAAHGHADALSFTLDVDSLPYIVDSGTYIYHGDNKWRHYFVSTLAHNTIRINGKDQAEFIGPTFWGKKYKTKTLYTYCDENRDEVIATCRGYLKTRHQRKVLFDKKNDRITVADEVSNQGNKTQFFEFCLHLHPEVKIERLRENVFILKRKKARAVKAILDKNYKFSVVLADAKHPLGWYSPRFMQKFQSSTIYAKIRKKGKLILNTTLEI